MSCKKRRWEKAELALRFWREHQNPYAWAPIPLFVRRADYRCLELALIQEWQPRLKHPFICQFFHPRKGLCGRAIMSKTALDMQTLALGQRCIRQRRGSPMASPLSPALCLMVVSISEQIWSFNFRETLTNHNLFIRHIQYVDNRLVLATSDFNICLLTKSS